MAPYNAGPQPYAGWRPDGLPAPWPLDEWIFDGGDAKAAVKSIERFGARRFLSPLLYDRLRRAANDGTTLPSASRGVSG